MKVAIPSFGKINLGLYIGGRRADGFHELRTVYQTVALHDVIQVEVGTGSGIEIVCDDERVPRDSSNTCYRVAEKVMDGTGARGLVRVEIRKRLPVQGGLGAASSNGVATMLALERALKRSSRNKRGIARDAGLLSSLERVRIAAEVGSDLPLFLIGGTVLGVGHGEEVYPLPDLPALPIVVVTPETGVSTPRAFAAWDALMGQSAKKLDGSGSRTGSAGPVTKAGQPTDSDVRQETTQMSCSNELTSAGGSDTLEAGHALSAWLSSNPASGAPAKGRSRAGSLLSDLVRAGIENDFERVVFSEFPELRDMKCALERAGSRYASLSGSGSTLYGLFESAGSAEKAVGRLQKQGLTAMATRMLTRREYWKRSLTVELVGNRK